MLKELKDLLGYLNNTLDSERFGKAESLHKSALQWNEIPRLPIIASYPYPSDIEIQPFSHGQIFDNPEKMLFNQLVSSFENSLYLSEELGDDLPATIRPDFGCVLIASMFGATVEQVDNNPPWIRHGDLKKEYKEIINTDPSDFSLGWVPKVIECYKFYHEVLKDYTNLSNIINIVLPDLQGPFDNLELIQGSEVFLDMYSQKSEFLDAMRVVATAQIELVKYLSQYVRENISGIAHQHNFPLIGKVLLRNDTSIMVSPEMYREMIAPYDEMILESFGGGVHSCGKVDAIVPEFMSLKSIDCFDFGQSEMNDIEVVYRNASEKKIPLTRVAVSEEELDSGDVIKKYPTGISLVFRAKSFEHAKFVIEKYKDDTCRMV